MNILIATLPLFFALWATYANGNTCPATTSCRLEPIKGSGVSGSVTMLLNNGQTEIGLSVNGVGQNDKLYLSGHTYGDLRDSNNKVGAVFTGSCNSCRTSGQPQQAGAILGGASVGTGPGDHGVTDPLNLINGANSLVGRSLVLKSGSTAVAACVVGRTSDQACTGNTASVIQSPTASCIVNGRMQTLTPCSP